MLTQTQKEQIDKYRKCRSVFWLSQKINTHPDYVREYLNIVGTSNIKVIEYRGYTLIWEGQGCSYSYRIKKDGRYQTDMQLTSLKANKNVIDTYMRRTGGVDNVDDLEINGRPAAIYSNRNFLEETA